jgi:xanthine/CO dehydrogenase XdhC/CoxF family maturation factor
MTNSSSRSATPTLPKSPIDIRASNWTEADMRSADMRSTDTDILKAAEEWRKGGREVALATVVETWGSAPRPVGSNLVIDGDGNFLGSVSGGCVEGAVVTEALDVIDSGKSKMLEFGVADETAWKVGLSCGGTIRVYVEKVE